MNLNQCHPDFQASIAALAAKYSIDAETVYGCWRDYSRDCRNFDQSPVLFEFENWYKDHFAKLAAV